MTSLEDFKNSDMISFLSQKDPLDFLEEHGREAGREGFEVPILGSTAPVQAEDSGSKPGGCSRN